MGDLADPLGPAVPLFLSLRTQGKPLPEFPFLLPDSLGLVAMVGKLGPLHTRGPEVMKDQKEVRPQTLLPAECLGTVARPHPSPMEVMEVMEVMEWVTPLPRVPLPRGRGSPSPHPVPDRTHGRTC